jgi:hypothetical protein
MTDAEYPWARSRLRANEPFITILTRNERRYNVCEEQGQLVNKFGSFAHEDIVDHKFGTTWVSRTPKMKQGKAMKRRPVGLVSLWGYICYRRLC